MKRYEEALAVLDNALEIDPEAAWIIGQKGFTLREMKRYEEALAVLDNALEIDPQYAWAIGHKGVIQLLQEDFLNSFQSFKKCLTMPEVRTVSRIRLVLGSRKLEQNEEAHHNLVLCIQEFTKDDQPLYDEADILCLSLVKYLLKDDQGSLSVIKDYIDRISIALTLLTATLGYLQETGFSILAKTDVELKSWMEMVKGFLANYNS
jgi:tetratricopeptide (TPR) repeat protein